MDVVATRLHPVWSPSESAPVIHRLLDPARPDGKPITNSERILAFLEMSQAGTQLSAVPALPLLLNLDNKPYELTDHFPFEPVFRFNLPKDLVLKTGRQVSKSTSLAARSIVLSNSVAGFRTLYITPLYEQIRKFSTNYVRKFIETSPVRSLWMSTGTINSVLQRSFRNLSEMYFSFALTDADRVRGVSAHACNFDEVQDMDKNLIPIIKETMSHSPWKLAMYTGTPKTLDNTIQSLWGQSSQAEWMIPCLACGKENIPCISHDLERMIGPWSDNICVHRPGVICASSQCGRPIFPKDGRWEHRVSGKLLDYPGYHIPQIIMPIHYADKQAWGELLGKQQGYGNVTVPQFYNEVLGESYDIGTKLVTKTELQTSSNLPWVNNPKNPVEPLRRKNTYSMRVVGVDWGGGGEEETSFTTIAVCGLRPDGKIDVIFGERLLYPHMKIEEAIRCLQVCSMFDAHKFAHDYNGAGDVREAVMIQAGLPMSRVVPMVYYRSAARNIMTPHKSEDRHSRDYWHLDKARALGFVCQCIKLGLINFFQFDEVDDNNRGLISDFLALQENKIEMARGSDIYQIQRNPAFPDDFAHSVTFACCTIWHITQHWPNITARAAYNLTPQQQAMVSPRDPWKVEEDLI